MTKNYCEAVKTLEELFNAFNAHLFNSEINAPVITISPDTTRGAYGWCTTKKIWKTSDGEYYEINICAEYLNRAFNEVCDTLIHEMVHLHNIEHGVQDTSANGRYHNKMFKETAEAHGLVIEKDSKYGWTITKLHETTATWIETNIEHKGFDLARAKRTKATGKQQSKYHYYMCPCCGVKFYSVHNISAACNECGCDFVQYK